MGTSHGDFIKYPRTPHLFGSKGTADDRHLNEKQSVELLSDASLIVEEKLDGTNVGIHFSKGELVLQCRGHEIREGMHPQYDLFKQWVNVKRFNLESQLTDRYILYGEWLYAKHTIHYRGLPHYFFEFDIYDKPNKRFLDLDVRLEIVRRLKVQTVPVLHRGPIRRSQLKSLIGRSAFDSEFVNPSTRRPDQLMEGLYLRTERNGQVTRRAKLVRPEFIEKIKQSSHWQQEAIVPNRLTDHVDIFA